MNVNNIFITGDSLGVESKSSLDDYENSLDRLSEFLELSPNYNNIEVCNDWLKYKSSDETFDDILVEISGFSDPLYTEMLKDVSYILKSRVGKLSTEISYSLAGSGLVLNDEFIGFYSQKNKITNVDDSLVVKNNKELLSLNYFNLEEFPINEKSFSDRSKLIFNNINFHNDFEKTLGTVKNNDFKKYSIEFTRSLKTLHNAFPRLTNKGHNPPDLKIIRDESSKSGRTMGCTVQGANKQELCNKSFEIKCIENLIHIKNNLNCEYHLKINFDNNDQKVNKKFYNRAYFGLPLINNKKYIALLHLGCHYE